MVYKSPDQWHYRLWPGRCLLCDAPAHRAVDLCQGCEADLPALSHTCRYCALPLNGSSELCGGCLVHPPLFNRCVTPLAYRDAVIWLIGQLKSGSDFAAARVLATLQAAAVRRAYASTALPDTIIAMPLHWRRLQQRGYNQATLLAQLLGREFDITVLDRGICRRRHMPSQHTLPRRHRYANVHAAFAVDAALAGHHVAVVDDVVTTGASVGALTRELLRAGAATVDIWCAARTPRPGSTSAPPPLR